MVSQEALVPDLLVGTTTGLYGIDRTANGFALRTLVADIEVNAATIDQRDGSLWVAGVDRGKSCLWQSRPDGSWRQTGEELEGDSAWRILPLTKKDPGGFLVGCRPGLMYRSDDGGDSWQPVPGFNQHPTSSSWHGGGAGLIVHALRHGREGRIYCGVSVAGLFVSRDGGETWTPRNEGVDVPQELLGDPGEKVEHPEVHRCIHSIAFDPATPGRMYQQNHFGVFRSDDDGDQWVRIDGGLPSTFGFASAVSPGPASRVFVIPQSGETLRTIDRLSVWHSDDEGTTWTESTEGLPTGELNVLRAAMDANGPVVAFGTTAGVLYLSEDRGETWTTAAEGLGRIQSVAFTR